MPRIAKASKAKGSAGVKKEVVAAKSKMKKKGAGAKPKSKKTKANRKTKAGNAGKKNKKKGSKGTSKSPKPEVKNSSESKLVKYVMTTAKGREVNVVRRKRVPLPPEAKKKLEKVFKTWEKMIVRQFLRTHPGDTRVGRWRLALTKEEAMKFAKEFHLTEQQVRKWFANRRRRQKKLDNEAAACLM